MGGMAYDDLVGDEICIRARFSQEKIEAARDDFELLSEAMYVLIPEGDMHWTETDPSYSPEEDL